MRLRQFNLILSPFLFSWSECHGDYYYFNFQTGDSQWEHPLDEIYRQKVTLGRHQIHGDGKNIIAAGVGNWDNSVGADVTDGDTSDLLSSSLNNFMEPKPQPKLVS